MTTEERTMTEERLDDIAAQLASQAAKLDDIAARLFKLEALIGDEDVTAGLEAMSFTRRMNRYEAEEIAKRKDEPLPAEDGTAPIDAKTPGDATPEEGTPTRIGGREPWVRELLGEVAEEADTKRDGVRPIVVRLTGDRAIDAAALKAANAKRAEVEIATGRAPNLITFDPLEGW